MRLVLGTRGSDLARAQTTLVENALRRAFPDLEMVREIIRTSGDEGSKNADPPAAQGRKGMFTAEIERALREGQIDVAVHSAKDLPSEMTPDLEVVATLARAPLEDVLVTKTAGTLAALPEGAKVATGSVRRQRQLLHLRPDIRVLELRGNVPTRLRKLSANEWDGIILARAGLERLGYDGTARRLEFAGVPLALSVLPTTDFLPAGGQGIVALQIRAADEKARPLLAAINHAETLRCLRAEREFLRLLQGDCGTPVGVMAEMKGARMTMRAQLFREEKSAPRTAMAEGDEPIALAARLWESING